MQWAQIKGERINLTLVTRYGINPSDPSRGYLRDVADADGNHMQITPADVAALDRMTRRRNIIGKLILFITGR